MEIPKNITKRCVEMYRSGASRMDVARCIMSETGLKETAAKVRAKNIWDNEFDDEYEPQNLKVEDIIPDSSYLKSKGLNDAEAQIISPTPITLDDLLKMYKVDLEVWYVESHEINSWPMGRKDKKVSLEWNDGRVDGFVEDSGKLHVERLYQIKARLKRKLKFNTDKAVKSFIEKCRTYSIKDFNVGKSTKSNILYQIEAPDLHVGQLTWSRETNWGDYDTKIALRLHAEAFTSLLSHAPVGAKVLLPIGNDLFNVDNHRNTTTAGTPQTEDNRWQKTFSAVKDHMIDCIGAAAQNHQIDVLMIAGNHDYERAYYLGEVLSAFFSNHPNVKINNEPNSKKYYRFGTSLLGFCHGKDEKPIDLPLTMVKERSVDYCETSQHYWYLGHFHHEILKEIKGDKIRFLPSLSPPDAWHNSKNFIGCLQSAMAFEYDENKGLVGNRYYYVD